MTAEEIKKLVRDEFQHEFELSDVNGHDLASWSYEPIYEDYKDKTQGQIIGKLWTVFEERTDRLGYYIYLDEKSLMFGLGVKDDDGIMIRIGDYGSFLRTLRTM
jgi:hypothetical protein